MNLLKYFVYGFLVLCILYILFVFIAPPIVEKGKNKISIPPPYETNNIVSTKYKNLPFVADLHCDALLWNRNLSKKYSYGHVDIPRMQENNIALQTFSIVTKSPAGQNMISNRSNSRDRLTLLFAGQGAPFSTWFSLYERAAFQCRKLHQYENDKFRIVKSKSDLKHLIESRKENRQITSGLLAVEGAHCLEGDIKNVDKLFNLGVRMMAPTHFFDNELGGSAHGISKEGLTPFGIEVIKRMNSLDMIIDMAHISPQMIDDILRLSSKPVVVSHTGIKSHHKSPRNLSDDQIRRIAQRKGLIGIAYFEGAIGSLEIKDIVNHIRYTMKLVGYQHVTLGSDFDGSVTTPFDISGLPLLVKEMINQGFNQKEMEAIMGGNIRNFLMANLPE